MSKSIPNISTMKALYDYIRSQVVETVGEAEAGSIAHIILDHHWHATRTDVVLQKPVKFSPDDNEKLSDIIARIKKNEPIQYILGKAHFLGRDFFVSPQVLIPRPETEELVQLIIVENPEPGKVVLDVGTGSGCIAISLQKQMVNAEVFAIDFDASVLDIAAENARHHQACVHFLQVDVLQEKIYLPLQDIIVSNPPYVTNKEAKQMHSNVLEYEPQTALFVPDEDPLLFYRHITGHALELLAVGGKLYFEINEAYGAAVAALLKQHHFFQVKILHDMQGKDRMVCGTLQPPGFTI